MSVEVYFLSNFLSVFIDNTALWQYKHSWWDIDVSPLLAKKWTIDKLSRGNQTQVMKANLSTLS